MAGINAFARSLELQTATLASLAGVSIIYSRGAYSVNVTGVIASRDVDGDLVEYVTAANTDAEFLVTAADLILNSLRVYPESGDIMQVGLETAKTDKFIVLPPDGSDRCWKASDPFGHRLRIFAKHRFQV